MYLHLVTSFENLPWRNSFLFLQPVQLRVLWESGSSWYVFTLFFVKYYGQSISKYSINQRERERERERERMQGEMNSCLLLGHYSE